MLSSILFMYGSEVSDEDYLAAVQNSIPLNFTQTYKPLMDRRQTLEEIREDFVRIEY